MTSLILSVSLTRFLTLMYHSSTHLVTFLFSDLQTPTFFDLIWEGAVVTSSTFSFKKSGFFGVTSSEGGLTSWSEEVAFVSEEVLFLNKIWGVKLV
jgi:hypothetical protein